MKHLFVLLFTLSLLNAASITWEDSYKAAIAKAKSEDKPLFVYLYQESCHTCNYMENDIFKDKSVADYIEKNYIAVKFNSHEGDLPKELEVEMYPVFHFLNSQNRERIESIIGGRNAQKFLMLLEACHVEYKEENK